MREEEKEGRRKVNHPHTHYLALYSTPFQRANSRKVTSWVFSCISDAIGVFILEYALLYAIWEVLNKNPSYKLEWEMKRSKLSLPFLLI